MKNLSQLGFKSILLAGVALVGVIALVTAGFGANTAIDQTVTSSNARGGSNASLAHAVNPCSSGYTLVGAQCRKTVPATAVCPSGYTVYNSTQCRKTVPATAVCEYGYTVYNSTQCRKTVPATAVCEYGYTVYNSTQCRKTVPATAVCPSGFSPSGSQCSKTVPATAVCPSGFSPSGSQCSKTVPATAVCPSGYTVYNSTQCRKTVPATVGCSSGYTLINAGTPSIKCRKIYNAVWSTGPGNGRWTCPDGGDVVGTKCFLYDTPTLTCSLGTLSGTSCHESARPTSYTCPLGTLSGTSCHESARPTSYTCPLGTLSGTSCNVNARPTSYNCPLGTLSGTSCNVNARPTSYTCPLGTLSGTSCNVNARPTSYTCPLGTLSGTSCNVNARPTSYNCSLGTLSGTSCHEYATPSCPSNHTLTGNTCVDNTPPPVTPTPVVCDPGKYKTSSNTCITPSTAAQCAAAVASTTANEFYVWWAGTNQCITNFDCDARGGLASESSNTCTCSAGQTATSSGCSTQTANNPPVITVTKVPNAHPTQSASATVSDDSDSAGSITFEYSVIVRWDNATCTDSRHNWQTYTAGTSIRVPSNPSSHNLFLLCFSATDSDNATSRYSVSLRRQNVVIPPTCNDPQVVDSNTNSCRDPVNHSECSQSSGYVWKANGNDCITEAACRALSGYEIRNSSYCRPVAAPTCNDPQVVDSNTNSCRDPVNHSECSQSSGYVWKANGNDCITEAACRALSGYEIRNSSYCRPVAAPTCNDPQVVDSNTNSCRDPVNHSECSQSSGYVWKANGNDCITEAACRALSGYEIRNSSYCRPVAAPTCNDPQVVDSNTNSCRDPVNHSECSQSSGYVWKANTSTCITTVVCNNLANFSVNGSRCQVITCPADQIINDGNCVDQPSLAISGDVTGTCAGLSGSLIVDGLGLIANHQPVTVILSNDPNSSTDNLQITAQRQASPVNSFSFSHGYAEAWRSTQAITINVSVREYNQDGSHSGSLISIDDIDLSAWDPDCASDPGNSDPGSDGDGQKTTELPNTSIGASNSLIAASFIGLVSSGTIGSVVYRRRKH